MDELSGAPLHTLLELLAGAGVSATMDPGNVRTPGAWVALEEVRARTVGGQLQLRCAVYLVHSDTDALRAIDALGPMLTKVRTVLHPDGPVTATNVVLPADPTPLPALRVPVHLT